MTHTQKCLLILFLVIGITPMRGSSQEGKFLFDMTVRDPWNMLEQQSYYQLDRNSLSSAFELTTTDRKFKSPIMLGVLLNAKQDNPYTAPVKSITKSYTAYIVRDSSEVEIVALGINKENVKDYRYRVIENDSTEVMPWAEVSLEQKYGTSQPYGAIGKFRSPGKLVLIEVVNTKDYSTRDGIVIDWRPNFRPVLTQFEVNTSNNFFNLNYLKVNRGYATKFKETNIPLNFKFPQDSIRKMRLHLKNHETVPYVITLLYWPSNSGGTSTTKQLAYYFLDDYYDMRPEAYAQPGRYQIVIQRVGNVPESQILRIDFEVLPPPPPGEKKVALKQLIPYSVAALSGVAILFFAYRRQSRIKIKRLAQQEELSTLKLRSIRSQLNPHFMFNALSSIQNLVNKHDIDNANNYLSKFADLTRHVLDSSNEEMLSLEDELRVLDNYLQMEKLRFNFSYRIDVEPDLDIANLEVPAMLLQPFVENAIKHGIATMAAEGNVKIVIRKEENNLIMQVCDNGKGIDDTKNGAGYGIKLSKDRLALLNQVYPDQPMTLNIERTEPGTRVSLQLNNWI